MDETYWDGLAKQYEGTVFNVLEYDRAGVIAGFMDRYGSQSQTAMDLGCGIGGFVHLLAQKFLHVIAVDLSAKLLARAREDCHELANVEFHQVDLSQRTDFAAVPFCLAVNSLITSSLTTRDKMVDVFARQLQPGGHLLLVVPSLESAMYRDYRQIEWNLQEGMSPATAVRAEFKRIKRTDTPRLNQGLVEISGTPTKHFLREELIALLATRSLQFLEIEKIEYPWTTEFHDPPKWLKEPFPWDWAAVFRKG